MTRKGNIVATDAKGTPVSYLLSGVDTHHGGMTKKRTVLTVKVIGSQ
jgi:hypothetical protein